MASPREQPVNEEKFLTHLSRLTALNNVFTLSNLPRKRRKNKVLAFQQEQSCLPDKFYHPLSQSSFHHAIRERRLGV